MKTLTRRCSLLLAFLSLAALAPREASGQEVDAGPDRTVAAGENCDAAVTLTATTTGLPPDAMVTLTWTGSFPEGDGAVTGAEVQVTLPPGEHVITLTLEDEAGETLTDTVTVTVEDRTAPTIEAVHASPDLLWPPNHKMVPVALSLEVSDNCDEAPVARISSIRSNEPVNGRGDGNTAPDWRITGDLDAHIRSERAGPGNGRIYTLEVECSDGSDNTTTATAEVRVPHDGSSIPREEPPDRDDRTKCAFRVDFEDIERNRLLARLDVSEVVDQIPEIGTDAPGDNLAGYDLLVEIGIEEVRDTFDDRGRIRSEELRARLSFSGFLIVDLRGLDLPEILDLDPDRDLEDEPVFFSITAVAIPPENVEGVAEDPIVLFEDILTCTVHRRSEDRARGKLAREPKSKKNKGGKKKKKKK